MKRHRASLSQHALPGNEICRHGRPQRCTAHDYRCVCPLHPRTARHEPRGTRHAATSNVGEIPHQERLT